MKILTFILLLAILLFVNSADVKRASHSHGHVKRSYTAKAQFKRLHPCPATGESRGACPGWIIDHIKPLACGGADHSSNMQWQTIAEAKAKDRWERKDCQISIE